MAGQKVFKSTKCTHESESSDIDSSRPSSSRSVTPAPSFSLQCRLISPTSPTQSSTQSSPVCPLDMQPQHSSLSSPVSPLDMRPQHASPVSPLDPSQSPPQCSFPGPDLSSFSGGHRSAGSSWINPVDCDSNRLSPFLFDA